MRPKGQGYKCGGGCLPPPIRIYALKEQGFCLDCLLFYLQVLGQG